MKCLVTGGAGFIGSHLVKHLLSETDWHIKVWDSMTYAALGGSRLEEVEIHPRFSLFRRDVCDLEICDWDPDYVVHLAAETHVERSIEEPGDFLVSNVMGTFFTLQAARKWKALKKLLYFSTDEVFGSACSEEVRDENAPFRSGNPYAATKAAGEELALAWGNTYKIPVVISHCSNVFGPDQHGEKFIPKLVRKIDNGELVKIHSDEEGNVGSRMYVYAQDVARAIVLLLEKGEPQEKYNIPGNEITNLAMAQTVASMLGKPLRYEKTRPDDSRPGWDFAYRISGEKIKWLGWQPEFDFWAQLKYTVESYARTPEPQK